jgi:hypothetical protein
MKKQIKEEETDKRSKNREKIINRKKKQKQIKEEETNKRRRNG